VKIQNFTHSQINLNKNRKILVVNSHFKTSPVTHRVIFELKEKPLSYFMSNSGLVSQRFLKSNQRNLEIVEVIE
jgi:hypothetical protein